MQFFSNGFRKITFILEIKTELILDGNLAQNTVLIPIALKYFR